VRMPNLTARSLKATLVLEPAQLAELVVRDGVPRVELRIEVDGRLVVTDIAAKSARKALAGIREHGPDGVMAILQGKLGQGDVLLEAGLVGQPKVPKAAARSSAPVTSAFLNPAPPSTAPSRWRPRRETVSG